MITPDGGTLIVGETWGNRFTAFDIAADGSLTNRRVWGAFGPEPVGDSIEELLGQVVVAPDGCTLDAEGHIWVADGFGSRVLRVAPGGAIVDEIAGPGGMGVFACALGGDDGRHAADVLRAGLLRAHAGAGARGGAGVDARSPSRTPGARTLGARSPTDRSPEVADGAKVWVEWYLAWPLHRRPHADLGITTGIILGVAMTLRLDEQESDALRRRAELEGRSMQDVARQAVRDYIERTSKRELLDRVLDNELPRYAEALERLGQ